MEEKLPRVLVGVTTYYRKEYIFDRFIRNLQQLDYPAHLLDVLIVDNSPGLNYTNKVRRRVPKGYKVVHIERGANSRVALTRSQNYIRKYMLERSYDYLLLVESDLLPDPQALKRLLAHDKPVVGSTYIIGTGDIQLPCIFMGNAVVKGLGATRQLGTTLDPETGKKGLDLQEVSEYLHTGLRQCHGCGFGCTLVQRDIVERFPFWVDKRLDNKHSDVYWYMDLEAAGVPVFVDTDHIIFHQPIPWESVSDR